MDGEKASRPQRIADLGTDVNISRLVGHLLDQRWHERCAIIENYMPPFPRPDTQPKLVIRYNREDGDPSFLRYSGGPKQGFFWDCYGDDFLNVELAIIALSKAPTPFQR